MKFYKAILKKVADPMKEAYGKELAKKITLDERLPKGKCPDCDNDEWYFLPKESTAVKEGGKPYIECLCCGYVTHL